MCVDRFPFYKTCEVQWVISKGLGFIPDNADPQRDFIELSKEHGKTR